MYPSSANFCARCGQPLVTVRSSTAARDVGLGLGIIFVAFVAYIVFAAVRPSNVTEKLSFELPSSKAEAVFDLLKPQDVEVLVYRNDGCVQITGTGRECDAVAELVELITRYGGMPAGEVNRRMERARKGWTTRRTYKLSEDKAQAFFNVLAPDDVPVLVSLSSERLRVDATPQDQRIIRDVVKILRRKRL